MLLLRTSARDVDLPVLAVWSSVLEGFYQFAGQLLLLQGWNSVSAPWRHPAPESLNEYIVDVAHYVPFGSPIYMDALERGTSCYLADRVIPMLPRQLSNGICSLDPNVERLAMSYEFDVFEDGSVGNFVVRESVIKSRKAFTYNEVQAIYDGD